MTGYGFSLANKTRDTGHNIHYIYKKGEVNLDILYSSSDMSIGNPSVSIWMYQGTVLESMSITKRINKALGSFFDADTDFARLSDTYDSDYDFFDLYNYAGNDYSSSSPLYVVTFDSETNHFNELRTAYKNLGYSQYKADGKIYSYITRGSSHYIYNKGTTFIDMAIYPTTDYTYTGHDEYEYRIEIIIYSGQSPITPSYKSDLSEFVESQRTENQNQSPAFTANLKEGVKIETLKFDDSHDYSTLYYGYYTISECFIYPGTSGMTIDEIYNSVIDGLSDSGYNYASSGSKSETYEYVYKNGESTSYFYVTLIKGPNYVRVMNGPGGADF